MKPRFVEDMKNLTVEVGQDATFVCVVSEIHVSRVQSVMTGPTMFSAGISGGLGPGQQ